MGAAISGLEPFRFKAVNVLSIDLILSLTKVEEGNGTSFAVEASSLAMVEGDFSIGFPPQFPPEARTTDLASLTCPSDDAFERTWSYIVVSIRLIERKTVELGEQLSIKSRAAKQGGKAGRQSRAAKQGGEAESNKKGGSV